MSVWTGTLKTFQAGDPLLASELNDNVRDVLAALSGGENAYTPTLGGFTLGDGTASGGYAQVGKFVMFQARFTFGSTSAAASAVPTLTFPATTNGKAGLLVGEFYDASAGARYRAATRQASSTTVGLYVHGTNGLFTAPSTTVPFTWTTSDQLLVWGYYWAA